MEEAFVNYTCGVCSQSLFHFSYNDDNETKKKTTQSITLAMHSRAHDDKCSSASMANVFISHAHCHIHALFLIGPIPSVGLDGSFQFPITLLAQA